MSIESITKLKMEDKNKKDETLANLINSDLFINQEKLLYERQKSVKNGPNVIHLEYLDVLNETDLSELNKKLNDVGLELSSFNKSGILYNSLEEYSLVTFLVLNQPLIIELLNGIGTNAIWDTIKFSILSVRSKIKGKYYNKYIAGSNIGQKEMKFGIKVKLDRNTCFDMELGSDVSDETVEKSLSKVLDFLKEQIPREKYKMPDYVYFSEKEDKWIKLDVMEEIRKKIKKKKKKKKK